MKAVMILPVLLIMLFIACPAHSGSPVWKVEKGDYHLFLGGTVHLLTPADYPLPSAFEAAYRQSGKLVLETDVQKLQSPGVQHAMLQKLMYADGQNLQQVLSENVYQNLADYCSSRGIPMASLLNFKPGMVVMTLTLVELQRLGLVGTGVDMFFSQKALNDQKKQGQLETVEEQLEFIAAMGAGREDELINYTLRDMKSLPTLLHSLKGAWRQGDMGELHKVALEPFRKEFPQVYDSLLVKRNQAWMPLIEEMLKTSEVEFVLVGALHLIGEDGLLEQLAAIGYKIEEL